MEAGRHRSGRWHPWGQEGVKRGVAGSRQHSFVSMEAFVTSTVHQRPFLGGHLPELVGESRSEITFHVVKDNEIQFHFLTGTESTRTLLQHQS